MPTDIKFGTDGWRAVIADDYTYENIRRVGGGIASYVLKNEDPSRGLLVAWDTRFASREFAHLIAEVLADAGINIQIANDYTPTPALSYAVKNQRAAGGVMITSSHNPWNWNGVKFKETFGGSARPSVIKIIEEAVRKGEMPKGRRGTIEEVDFKAAYVDAITKFADLEKIKSAGFRFLIDCMYGAGRNVLSGIFAEHGIDHVQIHSAPDPMFGGINPEPIEPWVNEAKAATVREKCDAGLIVDGDADRVGAVTEDGMFVDAHKCFAILLKWLLEYKKWPGAVTRAYNTTLMLDRIAKKYGRELIEHGIGFKYVTDIVLSGKEVAIGGEESGGIGFPRHLPERDGTLNSLLLANAMADSGRTMGQLVSDLQQEFGQHHYGRKDLRIPEEVKQNALRRAATGKLDHIGKYKVLSSGDLDGIKFYLDAPKNGNGADAWVLLRASGTEPLMRIYCEASTPELVQEILANAEAFVFERGTTA